MRKIEKSRNLKGFLPVLAVFFVLSSCGSSSTLPSRSVEESISPSTEPSIEPSAEQPIEPSLEVSSEHTLTDREKIVEYMYQMSQMTWTPKENITYYQNDPSKVFRKDETYIGLPYTMESGRTTIMNDPLNGFINVLDSNNVYKGPTAYTKYYGSDCSSSVYASWKNSGYETNAIYTGAMIPGENSLISTIGNYNYSFRSDMTKSICEANGSEIMYTCYEKLQPGDAVVRRVKSGSSWAGHVRLVTEVDVINKEVTVIEQCGYGIDNQTTTTWRVHKKYSFYSLFVNNYIPIKPANLN